MTAGYTRDDYEPASSPEHCVAQKLATQHVDDHSGSLDDKWKHLPTPRSITTPCRTQHTEINPDLNRPGSTPLSEESRRWR
mmetsp:Transcript_26910/g.80685  ORF Transcript_26910/g.80685 Transcript_26910/m.80685 type:complete len:81 (+) Transcript_26910:503-745(+)